MSLKAATWSRQASPSLTPSRPHPNHTGHNKMALANILRTQGRECEQSYQTFSASKAFDQRNENDYMTSAGSSRHESGRTSSHSRTSHTSFGTTCQNGRYYCSYVCPTRRSPCLSWPEGYTTWYDLARHADAEHGQEEMRMIEAGYLSYETAQWVRSERHLLEIKRVSEEMFCEACGFVFSSNRVDSKERHIKNGACFRRQEKRRTSNGFESYTPKRKGQKTNPVNTRR